jgi:hypothetical protein
MNDRVAHVEALLKGKVDGATLARALSIARGGGAYDASPDRGELIAALLQFALGLAPHDKAALENLIEAHTNPRGAVADYAMDRAMPSRAVNDYEDRFPETVRIGSLGA